MRKVKFLVIATMMMGGLAATAQEATTPKWMVEVGVGTAQFGNYPSLSLFPDDTPGYSLCTTEQLSLLFHEGNNSYLGLTANLTGGFTSATALDERFMQYTFLLDQRKLFPLGSNFELEAGVAIGFLWGHNTFVHDGNTYLVDRFGMAGHFSAGLNYRINDRSFVGLKVCLPHVATYMNKPSLPNGVPHNAPQHNLNGYSLMLTFGVKH